MKKEIPSSFLDAVEYFTEEYIPQNRGLSTNTQESYKSTFRLLLEFMYVKKAIPADSITFKMLDLITITEFFDWITNVRKCSGSTVMQRRAVLRSFSKFAQNWDYQDAYLFRNVMLKIPEVSIAKGTRTYFTEKEIKILLDLPNMANAIGRRDNALLCTMYASGVRAQEICDLQVKNVEIHTEYVVLTINGKRRKMRRLKIANPAATELLQYIKYRGIEQTPDAYVFSSQRSEKMTVSCVEDIYAKYVKKGKMQHPDLFQAKSYVAHSMRHTTACHMLAAGCSLLFIRDFLGHKSLKTTLVYAEMMKSVTDKALEKWAKKQFELYSTLQDEKREEDPVQANIPDFMKYKGKSKTK